MDPRLVAYQTTETREQMTEAFRRLIICRPSSDNRMRFLFTMSEIEGRKARRRMDILFAGRSAFVTPSARAPNETDKMHRKVGSAPTPAVDPSASSLGGARRDRTDDLMLAKHALSQLSYGPVSRLAGAQRLWWAWEDLNLRPHAYQARALTN